jgi:hypothetical protein
MRINEYILEKELSDLKDQCQTGDSILHRARNDTLQGRLAAES